jgi:uncharacterized protein YybS (DUF2232 family)
MVKHWDANQIDISKDIISGIAITGLIFAVSIYMPIIGFFSALFIPLPTLFYRSKLGRVKGAAVPVLACILMLAAIGKLSIDILLFAELLFLGFVLAELVELDLSIEKTVLFACTLVIATGTVGVFIYSSIRDLEIYSLITAYVKKNLELTLALYKSMGVSQDSIRMLSNSLDSIQYVLIRIIPALAISSTLFVSWTSLLLAKPLLKSKKLFFPSFDALKLWQAPEHLVWIAIGCGATLLFPNKALKVVALNGLLILMTIYFFQGIAIVSFYFEKKKFPRLIRFILYSFIALQQIILLVVIGLGFFDIWLNFRKLGVKDNH